MWGHQLRDISGLEKLAPWSTTTCSSCSPLMSSYCRPKSLHLVWTWKFSFSFCPRPVPPRLPLLEITISPGLGNRENTHKTPLVAKPRGCPQFLPSAPISLLLTSSELALGFLRANQDGNWAGAFDVGTFGSSEILQFPSLVAHGWFMITGLSPLCKPEGRKEECGAGEGSLLTKTSGAVRLTLTEQLRMLIACSQMLRLWP